MSLEESLDRNTKALQEHTAAILASKGGSLGADAGKTPNKGGRPRKITLAEVKAAAEKVKTEKDRPAAVALIKKFGAETLAELDESKYAAFVAAADVLLAGGDDDGGEGGGDDEL